MLENQIQINDIHERKDYANLKTTVKKRYCGKKKEKEE